MKLDKAIAAASKHPRIIKAKLTVQTRLMPKLCCGGGASKGTGKFTAGQWKLEVGGIYRKCNDNLKNLRVQSRLSCACFVLTSYNCNLISG